LQNDVQVWLFVTLQQYLKRENKNIKGEMEGWHFTNRFSIPAPIECINNLHWPAIWQ